MREIVIHESQRSLLVLKIAWGQLLREPRPFEVCIVRLVIYENRRSKPLDFVSVKKFMRDLSEKGQGDL